MSKAMNEIYSIRFTANTVSSFLSLHKERTAKLERAAKGFSSHFSWTKARMKKSPVHLRYEAGNYGFDPKLDFSQFLEEARKHASEEKPEGAAQPEEGKKKRKSWKRSLFPWWKSEQKSNSSREAPARSHSSKSRYGNVSAPSPIRESGGAGATGKPRRPTSGPLTGLFQFHPTKRVENEMPYLCLDKLTTDPYDVHSYGPVYLVT
ncbi:uncharacterized protein LOC127795839 isoform X3 [Diospyros lotus]|uniref:uncharacterized protein LOC127795839 isoform X3 n=1 Tax=Diospyros lotus TaxID=55363 RepID=UPI0022562E5F|nr:uncharacterized protein LOC127795839 isoform X3 [Diospyros lotus]